MCLLNVRTFRFRVWPTEEGRPRYAIASHRWRGNEATFRDVKERKNIRSAGYRKIEEFAKYVRYNVSSVDWLWMDTCCIDRHSSAELLESVNLMFQYYRKAEVCLVHLADVEEADDMASFARSEWFERGWTLQELLAPRMVVFLTESWEVIGNKGGSSSAYDGCWTGPCLERKIARITGISREVLSDYRASSEMSAREKMDWMEGRQTTKKEDMSYALCGILNVFLGANYGEGADGSRQRLRAAIREKEDGGTRRADDGLKRFVDSFSSPGPWREHRLSHRLHPFAPDDMFF